MSILAGFMVPHPPLAVSEVGRGEEKKIKETLDAYERVGREIAALSPETLIITSPHSIMYSDYFHISPGASARGDFSRFNASKVSFEVKYDTELVSQICKLCDSSSFPAGTDGNRMPELDHGTMVPLYFINKYYTGYKLVRIGLSGLSLKLHEELGEIIEAAVERLGRKAVFVASGDLSHCQKAEGPYGYKPEGPEYDKRLMEVMSVGSFEKLKDFDEVFLNKAEECGHRSFVIMAGALKKYEFTSQVLSHEATFGVGYGIGV
nr:AmmeMemoRadiSam system protein B [Lachnospiraceae bacterium]